MEAELDMLEAYTLRSEDKAIAASTERQSQQRNRYRKGGHIFFYDRVIKRGWVKVQAIKEKRRI